MNAKWSWIHSRVGFYRVSIGVALTGAALGGVLTSIRGAESGEPEEPDRSTWEVKSSEQAVEQTRQLLGLTEQAAVASTAAVASCGSRGRTSPGASTKGD